VRNTHAGSRPPPRAGYPNVCRRITVTINRDDGDAACNNLTGRTVWGVQAGGADREMLQLMRWLV